MNKRTGKGDPKGLSNWCLGIFPVLVTLTRAVIERVCLDRPTTWRSQTPPIKPITDNGVISSPACELTSVTHSIQMRQQDLNDGSLMFVSAVACSVGEEWINSHLQ